MVQNEGFSRPRNPYAKVVLEGALTFFKTVFLCSFAA